MTEMLHDWKPAGRLLGVQMQPRDISAGLYLVGFTETKALSTAIKVCLSESQGYTRAYNLNTAPVSSLKAGQKVRNVETLELITVIDPSKGTIKLSDGSTVSVPLTVEYITSKDVGVMQISILAQDIGTVFEDSLYDPDINFAHAFTLFSARGFQPWVAWNTNTFLRDTYLKRANKGLANWLADLDLAQTPTDTLNNGESYVHTLTTPVVDYMYRVVTQHQVLLEARTELKKTKPNITALRNIIYNSVDLYKA